ncbi:malonic semialdehyde reductase [Parvularcula sp. IMCC14364]|uniref:malonic semialdehyde reductase n=1 Tax=Parvularcula sp. IMCC14364 TaxID=3067902 RepID=UPI0027417587|nr:malonic semialdehyde reductase [Parvularcula sp. IMCC14364]
MVEKKTDNKPLNDHALDQLFREARTFNAWEDRSVPKTLIQALYDLMKFGATSANCSPARLLFLTSTEAKERLKPHLGEGNVKKTMSAPCVAVIGHDLQFHEHLPKLFPHTDAKAWFEGNPSLIAETAFRNGTLQGAYLMIASRALGLDCGPMSGFDQEAVSKEFFSDEPGDIRVNFLCNLGYGITEDMFERSPRFAFDDVCKVL